MNACFKCARNKFKKEFNVLLVCDTDYWMRIFFKIMLQVFLVSIYVLFTFKNVINKLKYL